MAKIKIIGFREVWWAWLGEEPAIVVESKALAVEKLMREGREYKKPNSSNRSDQVCAAVELLWNEPLPEGETYHRPVFSPVAMVLHKGGVRAMVRHLTPSRLSGISKSWLALEPEFPAWWPNQYHEAINDPETLILRGKKNVIEQLDARW